MNTEKIIVCSAGDATKRIQPLLDEGWRVKFLATENVSISGTGAMTRHNEGKIIFILFK